MRYLVLVAALVTLITSSIIFGHGMLFSFDNLAQARFEIISSLFIMYTGLGLMYWWQRLEQAHSLHELRLRCGMV